MRTITCLTAAFVLLVSGLLAAVATAEGEKETQPKGEERVYRTIAMATAIEKTATVDLDKFEKEFENQYVQLRDHFGEQLSENEFKRALDSKDRRRLARRDHIRFKTHFVFTTDADSGSNMLCFVARDNEEAKAFLSELPGEKRPIYMLGKIGRRMLTNRYGKVTLFEVDRVVAGDKPPPSLKEPEKKPIFFTIEYDVETGQGKTRRKVPYKYKIPKPKTTYEIADPYTGKTLYMTFEFY